MALAWAGLTAIPADGLNVLREANLLMAAGGGRVARHSPAGHFAESAAGTDPPRASG